MYFESSIQTFKQVSTAQEALAVLDSKSNAGIINSANDLILFINDSNPSGCGIHEVAVINQTQELQIESITWEWLKTNESKLTCINGLCKPDAHIDFNMGPKKVSLNAKDIANKLQWFECGCCGTGFQDYHKTQIKFDQDAGYGICPNCQKL